MKQVKQSLVEEVFGVLLIYCVLNAGVFIPVYSKINMLFVNNLGKIVFLQNILSKCFEKGMV